MVVFNFKGGRTNAAGVGVFELPLLGEISSNCDPLDNLDFNTFWDASARCEQQRRDRPEHKNLRSQMLGLSFMRGTTDLPGTRKEISTDKRVSIDDGRVVSNQERTRTFSEFLFAPFIFLFSVVVAFHMPARHAFNNVIGSYPTCPLYTLEMIKKVRISNCGVFKITPTINETKYDSILRSLGWENSPLNIPNLSTESGIATVLSFFNSVHKLVPDYFEVTTTDVFNKISIYSGDQTTFCALNFNTLKQTLTILQHNSFPMGTPTVVNITDARLTGVKLLDEDGDQLPLSTSAVLMLTNSNEYSLAQTLVDRTLGIEQNSSQMDQESGTTLPPRNETTPATTTSRRKWQTRNLNKETDVKINAPLKVLKFLLENYQDHILMNKFYKLAFS